MNWLKAKLRAWLGIENLAIRTLDLERHFVTRRDEAGRPLETLADVPVGERKNIHPRGMSWQQRKQWLEATDGGRMVARG